MKEYHFEEIRMDLSTPERVSLMLQLAGSAEGLT